MITGERGESAPATSADVSAPARKPEILAPAGGMESLAAAINCGADAVYLGLLTLNARRGAANFNEDELAVAAAMCRESGVKLYVTLNTIMFGDEVDELVSAVGLCAKNRVDGVIVQDFGVAQIIKKIAPEIPLIASTQMTVHNLRGALEAKRLGFKRVVLARELCENEIRRIASFAGIEVEVFAHGALCACVSGRCYLSSFIGGRSGNRGLCAQPCRLPFSVAGGGRAAGDEHALSFKDLSLARRVRQLSDIGVASLKIEGRMKRPEYVAGAVTALRVALDGKPPDMERLSAIFSRDGFTAGYFDNKRDSRMFGVRSKKDFERTSGALREFARLAREPIKRVKLYGEFTAKLGERVRLAVRDDRGNISLRLGHITEAARVKPSGSGEIRRLLQKTGATYYYFADVTVDADERAYIAASHVNSLRREAMADISRLRKSFSPYAFARKDEGSLSRKDEDSLSRKDEDSLLNEIADRGFSGLHNKRPILRLRVSAAQLSKELIAPNREYITTLEGAKKAIALGADPKTLIAEIPGLMFDSASEERALRALSLAKAIGVNSAWAGNIGALRLAREAGMTICAGWTLNAANSYAIAAIISCGAKNVEASPELSVKRLSKIKPFALLGAVAYGYMPLMALRNCPADARGGRASSLVDRQGAVFNIYDAGEGYFELLNREPLYMADKLSDLAFASFITLWFSTEDARACEKITENYSRGLDRELPRSYTRGLYYRETR